METLESKCMCRVCGKPLHNTVAINIFDSAENYETKIRTVLPIVVYETDCLPKYLCYNCSIKIQEFYEFYTQTIKIDLKMKRTLSWMRNNRDKEHNGVPTVFIANLRTLKVNSEIENFQDHEVTRENTTFNLNKFPDANADVKQSYEAYNRNELKVIPTPTTNNNNNQRHYKNNNYLPLNATIPLVRIDNERDNRIVTLVDVKSKISHAANPPNRQKRGQYRDLLYNNTATNKKCHNVITSKVLIKSEVKENDEFLRKLRPRKKSTNDKISIKQIKKEKIDHYKEVNVDKSKDLSINSKLLKKVKIKIEKLNCDEIIRNHEFIENTKKCDKQKNVNNTLPNNFHRVIKNPKYKNSIGTQQEIKPLRMQNNLKNMGTYESKMEVHIKGMTVKLTKINIDELKRQKNTTKQYNKIIKIKKPKKTYDTYSCHTCNELFTKRELYRLHSCHFR